MISTEIRWFDRMAILACDGKCSKAWGINCRPEISFDDEDLDDTAYLADDELGDAPEDPGTYEGFQAKPIDQKHNKWCARECERSVICEAGEDLELPDFSQRRYNQPWKHK
jgi:hypothetical protein